MLRSSDQELFEHDEGTTQPNIYVQNSEPDEQTFLASDYNLKVQQAHKIAIDQDLRVQRHINLRKKQL